MTFRGQSEAAPATDSSIQEALRRYMQQDPLPFAVTRGPEHTLIYVNTAFCQMAGVASGAALAAPITEFTAAQGQALSGILDRAFHDGVELPDQPISASNESGSGWQCSVWPVIGEDGRAEALGIQIRESSPPDSKMLLASRTRVASRKASRRLCTCAAKGRLYPASLTGIE